jgi:hypothetical protein
MRRPPIFVVAFAEERIKFHLAHSKINSNGDIYIFHGSVCPKRQYEKFEPRTIVVIRSVAIVHISIP